LKLEGNRMGKFITTQIVIPESFYKEVKQMAKEQNLNTKDMLVKLLTDALSSYSLKPDEEGKKSSSSSNALH
jgi:hypothetical protein